MNIHKIALHAGRPALEKIVVTESRVVAADGFILAITPNDGLPAGHYDPKSFGKHEKDANYPLQAPEYDSGTSYPDYEGILADRKALPTTTTFGIDVDLLVLLVDALRQDKGMTARAILELSGDGAIRVRLIDDPNNENRLGLIMPCKVP